MILGGACMLRNYILRNLIKKKLNLSKPLEEVRKDVRQFRIKQKRREATYIESTIINETPCLWVVPDGCDTNRFVLYLHGGGYCLAAYDTTVQRAIDLAESLKMTTLMIDYPVAPEYPFPCAIDKVNDIYESIADNKQVVLLGESSGCGLVLNLMVSLREKKKRQPVASVLLTPFLDATYTGRSYTIMKEKDPFYVKPPYIIADYYTIGQNKKNPWISPLFHDVHDLAPILIHVAEYDTLADDGTRLYEKLKKAHSEVEYRKWIGMWHLFHMQHDLIPEGKKAMEACKKFVHDKLESV